MKFQLTPAQMHRSNIAERAIQTFKNHFISILAETNRKYPKNEWDILLPQAELTMNLLRSSRINPRLSAEEKMNGTFDYNSTPLAPLGIKVLSFEMPTHRLRILLCHLVGGLRVSECHVMEFDIFKRHLMAHTNQRTCTARCAPYIPYGMYRTVRTVPYVPYGALFHFV